MRLCKECYEFLLPYIATGTVVEYSTEGECSVCDKEGLVIMPKLSECIDIGHLIVNAINFWSQYEKGLLPK